MQGSSRSRSVRMILIFILTTLMLVTTACGGPSESERAQILETLNALSDVEGRDAQVGEITFGNRDRNAWPFEATIVDEWGVQIGIITGEWVRGFGAVCEVTLFD